VKDGLIPRGLNRPGQRSYRGAQRKDAKRRKNSRDCDRAQDSHDGYDDYQFKYGETSGGATSPAPKPALLLLMLTARHEYLRKLAFRFFVVRPRLEGRAQ
jgi:hypothetical protein